MAKKKTVEPETKEPETQEPENNDAETLKDSETPTDPKSKTKKKSVKIDYGKRAKENFKPESLNIEPPHIDKDFSQTETRSDNPLLNSENNKGENQIEEKPKKRGRGRPKGSTSKKSVSVVSNSESDSGADSENFAALIPVFGNLLIIAVSKTGVISSTPLSSSEEKTLINGFKEAYPKIQVSPKATFFLIVITLLLSRAKI